MDTFERRLPVYILLDCSESMVGEGIIAVQQGLNSLVQAIQSDPQTLETVWLSIITFADRAEQVVPLTEALAVSPPRLRFHPGTSLGAALSLLHGCIRREVRLHTQTTKGDWRPIVFLLTDGAPTDDWEAAAESTRRFHSTGPLNVICIACGEDASRSVLARISDHVYSVKDISAATMSRVFQWMSASLSSASQNIVGSAEDPATLAEIPLGLFAEPAADIDEQTSRNRQIFLAVRCGRTRQPYLVRYRYTNDGYLPVRTHCIDDDYFTGQSTGAASVALSSRDIQGILPCPYCESVGAAVCGQCGTAFCASGEAEKVTCPGCNTALSLDGGDASIAGRQG